MSPRSPSSLPTPLRDTASAMAIAPSFGPGMSANEPRKLPAAVLAAPVMTASFISLSFSRFLHHLPAKAGLIFANLVLQRNQLADPVIDLDRPLIQDREQFRDDLPVVPLGTVDLFELDHLREGKPEDLETIDEFEPSDVVVGVDAFPVFDPADALQETDLLVIPDRPLGQVDHPGQLADGIGVPFFRRRGHIATLR